MNFYQNWCGLRRYLIRPFNCCATTILFMGNIINNDTIYYWCKYYTKLCYSLEFANFDAHCIISPIYRSIVNSFDKYCL